MTTHEILFQSQLDDTLQQDDKHSTYFFSWFQNKFQTIKAFVQDLRQLQIQITAKEDSDINKYTKAIANYLEHPEGLKNEKLYRNSLISLGNFLSIKYSFLKKQYLSQKFFKNLIEYFSILCEKQQKQEFNMLVYPIFYLIVLVIYNSDKQTSTTLYSRLFIKKFLRSLSSVQFQQGNRIQRYLPVIIAFIAKGSHNQQNSMLLKQIVLNNIHFCDIEKNHFHFIYCLRVLINKQSFTLGQVRRYNLLSHLMNLLKCNITSQQHVSMVLQVLKHILKRHQILGYKIVGEQFMNVIEKAYMISRQATLGLLQVISPCIAYKDRLRMLQVHTSILSSCVYRSVQFVQMRQLQSIKIVSIIIEQIGLVQLMRFLQQYSISSLLQRVFGGDNKLSVNEQYEVIMLINKIVRSLQNKNENIKREIVNMIYGYRLQNKKIQSIFVRYFTEQNEISELQ